jgi:hypothetical protein
MHRERAITSRQVRSQHLHLESTRIRAGADFCRSLDSWTPIVALHDLIDAEVLVPNPCPCERDTAVVGGLIGVANALP